MITKDMGIMEVVAKWPEAADVFMQHGMGCLGCAAARFESIEQGAMAHGMDIEALLADLNKVGGDKAEKKECGGGCCCS